VKAALALAVVLAGCADDRAGTSRRDCEAVLAHLVVLEGDSTPILCRFHPDCGGDEEDKFLDRCPSVLSRRELGCYQRATTIGAADSCLDRVELAARIDTGVVEESERSYGGGGGFQDGLSWHRSPEEEALASFRRLRDDACDCRDRACAERVEEKFRRLLTRFEADHGKPSEDLEREGERIYRQYSNCLEAARTADPVPQPTPYDPY
jgi:hypothetical protein